MVLPIFSIERVWYVNYSIHNPNCRIPKVHAETFAKNTAWVRRYGFIAFISIAANFYSTCYGPWLQHWFIIHIILVSLMDIHRPIGGELSRVIILNVLLWQGIMKLWEKVGYAGRLRILDRNHWHLNNPR